MTRVLLVDDNQRQRKLSRAYLEDAGYSVVDAAGALEALDAARADPPDVIVSDVMMDDIDGFGLCRRLRADRSLSPIPVLLVSAHYDDDGARRLATELGAAGLVVRTPDFSAEMAGIATCVSRREPVRRRELRDSYEAHLQTTAKQMTRLVEQARGAELRWRGVFEYAHDTITLLTPDGLIVDANHAWQAILGYAPDELIGRHTSDFALGPAEAHDEAFAAAAAIGAEVTVALRRKDGTTAHIEFRAKEIEIANTPHVLAIGRDVTEKLAAERTRRALEQRLAHAQRLEIVGQLAGGIVHNFNNILGAILSTAELLHDELPEGGLRDDANQILDAGRRAAALSRQLVAFSRQQTFDLVELDLDAVVRDVSRMLLRLIGAQVQLRITCAGGLPAIHADRCQLEQVIVNLVVNARDAMPSGGTLTIETRAEGDHVVLSVRDTGCGMTEEVLGHLFEPFFTTKGADKGTGLGLSTSYCIVRKLGGDIVATSRVGAGTTMEVWLPKLAKGAAP